MPDDPTRTFRQTLYWVVGLILAIFCLGAVAAYQTHKAAALHVQALQAEGKAAQLATEAAQARQQALRAQEDRDKATQEATRLSKALAAVPPPPKPSPAPASDPELQAGLVTAGLKVGLVVFQGEGTSSLGRSDAVKVWDWNQQAFRVPALELRLKATEDLVEGQKREAAAFQVEVQTLTDEADRWKAGHDAQADRAAALQAEAAALVKKDQARAWQTWLKVGGAAVAGFLIGGRR